MYGGKFRLAPWIITHFPAHEVYVEPFGGAASVLLLKPRSRVEIYNDLFGDVVNVFRVLRNQTQAAELTRLIELTPFAREEYNDAHAMIRSTIEDPVERARRTIFRSLASFGSAGLQRNSNAGFRRSTSYGKRYAVEWANYPQHIAAFTERWGGVIIENQSGEETIRNHDGPTTLFYVDPPYPHSTRNMDHGNARYEFEMSDQDHRQLAELLHSVRGMVVISGYRCGLYEDLYPDWKKYTKRSTAGGNGGGGSLKRTEVIWIKPGEKSNRLF
jgi:DNA adenine methylase